MYLHPPGFELEKLKKKKKKNGFSKVSEYKVKTENLIASLHTLIINDLKWKL